MAFTVADYILKRLNDNGVDTLFGVPAAYCSPLFDAVGAHGIAAIGPMRLTRQSLNGVIGLRTVDPFIPMHPETQLEPHPTRCSLLGDEL